MKTSHLGWSVPKSLPVHCPVVGLCIKSHPLQEVSLMRVLTQGYSTMPCYVSFTNSSSRLDEGFLKGWSPSRHPLLSLASALVPLLLGSLFISSLTGAYCVIAYFSTSVCHWPSNLLTGSALLPSGQCVQARVPARCRH